MFATALQRQPTSELADPMPATPPSGGTHRIRLSSLRFDVESRARTPRTVKERRRAGIIRAALEQFQAYPCARSCQPGAPGCGGRGSPIYALHPLTITLNAVVAGCPGVEHLSYLSDSRTDEPIDIFFGMAGSRLQ